MIWLIGNRGMLGTDVDAALKAAGLRYCASDMDVDIRDMEKLRGFADGKDIRWIVNCAAYTAVDRAEEEPDKACAINVLGVKNIATVARDTGAVLIHISTDYVFSGDKPGEYLESDATEPTGIYGESKLKGERYIEDPHHLVHSQLIERLDRGVLVQRALGELGEVVASRLGAGEERPDCITNAARGKSVLSVHVKR